MYRLYGINACLEAALHVSIAPIAQAEGMPQDYRKGVLGVEQAAQQRGAVQRCGQKTPDGIGLTGDQYIGHCCRNSCWKQNQRGQPDGALLDKDSDGNGGQHQQNKYGTAAAEEDAYQQHRRQRQMIPAQPCSRG